MNEQMWQFNQRDRRSISSALWPAMSLRWVNGLLLIKKIKKQKFPSLKGLLTCPLYYSTSAGEQIVRECSAFSPPLSEIWIVWQKSPLIFEWNVLIPFLGRESLRISSHATMTSSPFHPGPGISRTPVRGTGQGQPYERHPSPYTGMSYQE